VPESKLIVLLSPLSLQTKVLLTEMTEAQRLGDLFILGHQVLELT
jgi:hypothetical protein